MSETSSGRCETPGLHDLAAAVLAGGEVEDMLDLLVRAAHEHTGARTAALVLPTPAGAWSVELAAGADTDLLLGLELARDAPLVEALRAQDHRTIESITRIELGGITHRVALAAVDAKDQGYGALMALGDQDADPFTGEQRVQVAAIAILVELAVGGRSDDGMRELEDERTRIARDLHDLAIQELFAVGMELEGLTDALRTPGATVTDAGIRRSVQTSIRGVENVVAQIRQIVQSLRRERAEATLSERLRHETGLATAGLGFAPTLRLPPDPAAMDEEVPEEIAEDVVAVVRESLANAARHAHASAVAVAVTLFSEGVDRVVQVSVSDNGRGIDPAVTRRSGLANMSSRARRHSGWVDAINLEPGTMISWRVTLPPR